MAEVCPVCYTDLVPVLCFICGGDGLVEWDDGGEVACSNCGGAGDVMRCPEADSDVHEAMVRLARAKEAS
jgi:RecJ-like exonuclease